VKKEHNINYTKELAPDSSLEGQRAIVLFDGVCNFCNSSINFVIDRDSKRRFKFASLQSETGQRILRVHHLPNNSFDSIILVNEENVFQKSDAALEIARQLDGMWKVFYVFKIIPTFIRDFFYDIVAKNRYKIFGKSDTCRIPTPELKNRFL
jgi:predicted DCC family thiol-disulfide oxidoreductase YuxK